MIWSRSPSSRTLSWSIGSWTCLRWQFILTHQPTIRQRTHVFILYTSHIITSCQVKSAVISLKSGDFERHFSTNAEPRASKIAESLGPNQNFCITDWVQFSFAIWENFTQIVSCHFISNSMLLPGDAFSHSGDPGIFHGLPSQRGAGARPPSYCLPLLTNVVSSRFCA